MLVQLRKSFSTINRVHRFLYCARFSDCNLVCIVLGVLIFLVPVLCSMKFPGYNVVLHVASVIFVLLIFSLLPFVYVASIAFRLERSRVSNVDDHDAFSTLEFVKFGLEASLLVVFSLYVIFTFVFGVGFFDISFALFEYIIPLFFVAFSIISILWFGFLIANDVFDLQYIKVKVNQYIAWASVVSLLQIHSFKIVVASFGIILVAGRFVVYCLEERVLEKKNECKSDNQALPSV